MASSYPNSTNPGLFIGTTQLWGRTNEERLVNLHTNINNIALVLNLKDSGYYIEEEFVNGQLFFPKSISSTTGASQPEYRQVFRKVIDFGTLPNAGSTSVAHGINIDSNTTFTRIYGTANDTSGNSYLPLPYASTTLNQTISVDIDATYITITTGIDRTAYTTCYIVLEYLKQ